MVFGRNVEFDAVREVAFGSVGAAYAALGAVTSDYTRIFAVYNTTDTDVYISFDGVTDHLRVASGSGQVLDLTTNKVKETGFFLKKGTQVYQARAAGAPTVGNVWVQITYASGGI